MKYKITSVKKYGKFRYAICTFQGVTSVPLKPKNWKSNIQI